MSDGEESGGEPPLLSICVPTYNRARHVEALVQVLLAHVLDQQRFRVELVVVENACRDDTRARLAGFNHPALQIVHREQHLDTAEENMFRSLGFLRGRFVWFLGDDEVFDPLGFERLYALLQADAHDCLIFNSPVISAKGALVRRQSLPMNAALIALPMAEMIEAVGLLFTFAGVSNVVQRRSGLSEARALEWLARAPIYSHVAWMAQAHAHGRVVFVNAPLVLYRQNDYSGGHWERVAERHGVQDRFFWTLGLVRLIGRMVEEGVLSWAQAGRMVEVADDGRRYRQVDHMVHQAHAQLNLWASSPDSRQAFSYAEIDELRLFCLRCDPSLFDIVGLLEDHASALRSAESADRPALGREFATRFAELFQAREAGGLGAGCFVGRLSGYDVFQRPNGWVAVDADDLQLQAEVLAQVDPQAFGLDVLTSDSLAQMAEHAAAARAQRRSSRERSEAEGDRSPELKALGPRPLWRRAAGRARRVLQAALG